MLCVPDPESPRILSRSDCETLFHRIAQLRTSTWDFTLTLRSTWSLYFRWGRNRPTASGNTTEQVIRLESRTGTGKVSEDVTDFSENALKAIVQVLEQRVVSDPPPPSPIGLLPAQQYLAPVIWDDATYQTTIQTLSDAARQGAESAREAGLVAAGYAEVSAASWAVYNTNGLAAYAAVTGADYKETVRTIDGTGSGASAQRTLAWNRLNPVTIAKEARERCVASKNPLAIEPGRYTTILSPRMVCVMVNALMAELDRGEAEARSTVFSGVEQGATKIGTQVIDARLTLSSDPADPDCGYIPFDPEGNPYTKVTWIENGILKALAYSRKYAYYKFGTAVALPNPRTFRLTGGPTATMSINDMIAATDRGLYVAGWNTALIDLTTVLPVTGVTQNGVWLIEQGKITHPVKNLWFTESPMTALNKVLHVGPTFMTEIGELGDGQVALRDLPTRAVCDGMAVAAVPVLTVQDFNFTRLTDAI